jgi:hypothetical protein
MAIRPDYFSYNRREYARFKVDACATLYLKNNIKKTLKLQDISPRGVGGLIDSPIQVGEEVEIMLLYPFFEEPVRRKAKVVRCKEINKNTWDLGLDFGMDNKIDLTDYVKRGK